jgi:hypothetical protein
MKATIQPAQTEAAHQRIDDRRGDTRIPCALEVRCQAADGTEWPALAVNVSTLGARLISFLETQPPPLVSLRLKNRKDFTLELPAALVHAQGSRNLWMMGCRFARPLAEEELRALVPSRPRRTVSDESS